MNDDVSSALTLITAPTSEPLSLAQAKAFLRIEHDAEDEVITRAIAVARQQAEHYLRTALLPQVWEYTLAAPSTAVVSLPWGPAQSIASVTAVTVAGATTVLSSGVYRLSVDGRKVIFNPLPTTDILRIRYTAYFAAMATELPPMLMQGMLHHIAALTEARDGIAPMPIHTIQCYQPLRRIVL